VRLALPPTLTACAIAAAATLAPAAVASPALPPGANRPPVLPPGVIPAEAPVQAGDGQVPSPAGRLLPLGTSGVRAATVVDEHPWATVNICDTANRPNNLGVRAGMPGTGRRQLMFMRFTAQYWSPSRNLWLDVPGDGSSRWVYSGSARFATQQTGWTFAFEQPPAGTTFVMRAVVEQEWRGPESSAGSRAKRTGKRHAAAKRKAAKRKAARKRAANRGKPKRKIARFRHPAKPHEHSSMASASRKRAKAADPRARFAIAKQRTLLTKTGLEGVDGGDPAGTSKAMCLIW
jgi:hypothetical protein